MFSNINKRVEAIKESYEEFEQKQRNLFDSYKKISEKRKKEILKLINDDETLINFEKWYVYDLSIEEAITNRIILSCNINSNREILEYLDLIQYHDDKMHEDFEKTIEECKCCIEMKDKEIQECQILKSDIENLECIKCLFNKHKHPKLENQEQSVSKTLSVFKEINEEIVAQLSIIPIVKEYLTVDYYDLTPTERVNKIQELFTSNEEIKNAIIRYFDLPYCKEKPVDNIGMTFIEDNNFKESDVEDVLPNLTEEEAEYIYYMDPAARYAINKNKKIYSDSIKAVKRAYAEWFTLRYYIDEDIKQYHKLI